MLYIDLKVNKVSEQEVNGVGGEGNAILHDNDEEKDVEGNFFVTKKNKTKSDKIILDL